MYILTGDIGGTKTRLGLYRFINGSYICQFEERFESGYFSSFEQIVQKFFIDEKDNFDISEVKTACFGIPGPVSNGAATLTNLPWQLCEKELSVALNIPKVKLYNDVCAAAASIIHLKEADLNVVRSGSSVREKNAFALIAPGTGLGVAPLIKIRGSFYPLASEVGHIEFAPTDDLQIELLKYLKDKFKRVSYERVVSGQGIMNIFRFFKEYKHVDIPRELSERMKVDDPAAVVSETGEKEEFEICVKTLDVFAAALGTLAGDIVLQYMATGGIYLGGGIPPKMIKKLSDGIMVSSYLHKGRLTGLVNRTPIYIIKDDRAALLGGAVLAMQESYTERHK